MTGVATWPRLGSLGVAAIAARPDPGADCLHDVGGSSHDVAAGGIYGR